MSVTRFIPVATGLVAACWIFAACSAADGPSLSDDDGATGQTAGGGGNGEGGISLGTTGSGGQLEEECAETVAEPQVVPVSMFISVDKSGSMDGGKWNDTRAAFNAFFTDPAADDLNVAVRFWPLSGCDENSCSAAVCGQPTVPLGSLSDPGHESQLVNAFNSIDPNGNTPTSAALGGATQWAIDQQVTGEGAIEKFVVILVTDGSPNGCDESIQTISSIAGNAYNNHDVLTFAVGLQGSNENDMDAIAAAGGTTAGFFIGNGNTQADLIAALKAIQRDRRGLHVCHARERRPEQGGRSQQGQRDVHADRRNGNDHRPSWRRR